MSMFATTPVRTFLPFTETKKTMFQKTPVRTFLPFTETTKSLYATRVRIAICYTLLHAFYAMANIPSSTVMYPKVYLSSGISTPSCAEK